MERATGQTPLSVAVGNLAWPAMRCAHLLSELGRAGRAVDRSGGGLVVEVYPGAALRQWGLITEGTSVAEAAYKGGSPGHRARRERLLHDLQAALGDTVAVSPDFEKQCLDDDDMLDAYLCALLARAVHVGRSDPIPRGMRWLALREGWIHLPATDSLSRLLTPA